MTNREKLISASEDSPSTLAPQVLRRVIIENVEPQIDGGRFAIKRTVGEEVQVSADIYADGHDAVAAVVRFRRVGEPQWRESPMKLVDNDRWQAAFHVDALGRYEYTVEGWIDPFASWRQDLSKKLGAGQDVALELVEGAALVAATISVHPDSADQQVRDIAKALGNDGETRARVAAALNDRLAAFMTRHPDRSQSTSFDLVLPVVVER